MLGVKDQFFYVDREFKDEIREGSPKTRCRLKSEPKLTRRWTCKIFFFLILYLFCDDLFCDDLVLNNIIFIPVIHVEKSINLKTEILVNNMNYYLWIIEKLRITTWKEICYIISIWKSAKEFLIKGEILLIIRCI